MQKVQKRLTGCKLKVMVTGYTDIETYKTMKKKYPYLHPCPVQNGWWVYKKDCIKCDYAILEDKNAD